MSRKILNPTLIQLKELPLEGRKYSFSRDSGELNSVLQDVINNNDYVIDIEISPMGNAFQVAGKVSTTMNLVCSLCAIDFVHPIEEKFREILVVESEMPRSGKTSRVNHSTELDPSGPDYTVLNSFEFNVGEYVREILALAEPIRPLGGPDCDTSCPNLLKAYQEGWLKRPGDELNVPESPFSVLKDLKLNS